MPHCLAMLLALLALASVPAPASEDQNKKDLELLQGSWQLIKQTRNGQEQPESVTRRIKREVKQNTFTVTVALEEGERTVKSEFKLDATKTPREIDVKFTEGELEGQELKAIYEFEGDTFRTCYGEPGSKRPEKFDASEGTNQTISVWKKIDKKK